MSDIEFSEPTDSSERRRRGRGIGCVVALVLLAVVAVLGIFAYGKGVDMLKQALSSPEEKKCSAPKSAAAATIVEVDPGDTSADIGSMLCNRGIIPDYSDFIDAAAADKRSLSIQPGSYRLQSTMEAAAALEVLVDPRLKLQTPVTIPEGYRAKEALATIVDKTKFTAKEVQAAFAKLQKSGLPAYAHSDAEGYLFPSTYNVEPGTTAAELLKQMVAGFKTYADDAGLVAGADELGYTPGELVKIASLVQAEARRSVDMPKVAAVIYNRLDAGMPLQLDSTLHYAVDSRGVIGTSDDLRDINSPYNSYTLTGLPPTPIDSPGADAIEAALHPADASYLYFVTVNLATGQTNFATSYADHLHNVGLLEQYCLTSDEC